MCKGVIARLAPFHLQKNNELVGRQTSHHLNISGIINKTINKIKK